MSRPGDYDVTHGAGLAVMIPAWMKYVRKTNPDGSIGGSKHLFSEDIAAIYKLAL